MKKTREHVELLNDLTLQDLCRFCGAEETWVLELVEHGVLDPEAGPGGEWHFRGINIVRAKKARRLQRDLGINTPGIAMVLDLLHERDQLLRALGARGKE